jgi:hypothetical protein
MGTHFVITLDGAHLRFFTPHQWQGHPTFTAARVHSLQAASAASEPIGTSSHGLPFLDEEDERRRARDLAAQIETFLAARPDATWDFAAGPQWNHAVVPLLSPSVQARLRKSATSNFASSPPKM